MNPIFRLLYAVRCSRVYPFLTSLPYAPYRGAVLGFIDKGHESILEAGCGEGNLVRSRYFPKEISVKVGVEIFLPYALKANEQQVYNLTLVGDVRSLPFKDDAFDCVVCAWKSSSICPRTKGLS